MAWYWWIATVYGVGFALSFIFNAWLMIATGGMITPALVIFRAVTWPFFWTSWWRGEPEQM